MVDTIRMSYYWPRYEAQVYDYVCSCNTCEEIRRLNFDFPPMQSHADTDLKPGDRLIVDWAELDGKNYHIATDAASGFVWCREYKHKGTTEALKHYKEICNLMGRFGECHSDNGPSYRSEWDEELAKMGTDATHGAPYHPESQGAVEKAVGRVSI